MQLTNDEICTGITAIRMTILENEKLLHDLQSINLKDSTVGIEKKNDELENVVAFLKKQFALGELQNAN